MAEHIISDHIITQNLSAQGGCPPMDTLPPPPCPFTPTLFCVLERVHLSSRALLLANSRAGRRITASNYLCISTAMVLTVEHPYETASSGCASTFTVRRFCTKVRHPSPQKNSLTWFCVLTVSISAVKPFSTGMAPLCCSSARTAIEGMAAMASCIALPIAAEAAQT